MAFEVTLPEEFCTEVIYCFSTAEVKKKKKEKKKRKKSEPTVLVSFQDTHFETI